MIKIIGRPQMTLTGTALGLITRAEAKTHCKIDGTDDDTYIDTLIGQVIENIERVCGISIIAKTIVLTTDFTGEDFLPYPPVNSVTEVKHRVGTELDGTPEFETLTGDEYTTDGIGDLLFDSSVIARHTITYTAGYATLPEGLKLAILNEVAFRYQNRGDQVVGLNAGTRTLLQPYRRTFGI
jgi:uncharacterized phiE125 gp8 family phage protein